MTIPTDPGTSLQDFVDTISVGGTTGFHARFLPLYTVLSGGLQADNMSLSSTFAWTGVHSFSSGIKLNSTAAIIFDDNGDEDTSIRESAEDIITVKLGGTDRIRFDGTSTYIITNDTAGAALFGHTRFERSGVIKALTGLSSANHWCIIADDLATPLLTVGTEDGSAGSVVVANDLYLTAQKQIAIDGTLNNTLHSTATSNQTAIKINGTDRVFFGPDQYVVTNDTAGAGEYAHTSFLRSSSPKVYQGLDASSNYTIFNSNVSQAIVVDTAGNTGNTTFNGQVLLANTDPPTANYATRHGITKAWANIAAGATSNDDYNLASVASGGGNAFVLTWDTDFANTNYCTVATPFFNSSATQTATATIVTLATGSASYTTATIADHDTNQVAATAMQFCVMAIGDQ